MQTIPLGEIDYLVEQVIQTGHSVLAKAGTQIHIGPADLYVVDEYFEHDNVERPRERRPPFHTTGLSSLYNLSGTWEKVD